jgi:signal transduction histidine kinase
MTDAGARRLAKVVFAAELLMLAATVTFSVMETARARGSWENGLLGDLGYLLAFLPFPIIGLILALRQPRNALAWVMLVVGFFLVEPASAYGKHALAVGLPGAEWAIAADSWSWVGTVGLAGSFVLLLFPDGHLPSQRWRWFAWVVAGGMVVTSVAILVSPGSLADSGFPDIQNPFGVEALRPVIDFFLVALVTIPIGILGSALSLVIRYRRSGPTERLQIRWLAAAAAVVAVLYAITMFMTLTADASWEGGYEGVVSILQNVAVISFALVPISIAVAVLRHRLYDVNVVIRKAVVVAAIAVFFTIVYTAIVGGIGALVEARATTTLSFIAAAIVALLFQPALARARRIADRLVYGTRATPYELLAEFSDRVAETYADDEVLPRMARVVGEGIGAARADVWLRTGDRVRVSASWPGDVDHPETVPLDRDGGLPELPGADAAFSVEHRGELLGALAVAMPANDPMDEAKAKLVADLAAQAGLVLRNVRLTEDLRARLEDLKRAQKRLVAAQDEERRKLERNIHDGAQQQLVALAVRLRLARSLVGRDPEGAEAMLADLQTQATETLEDLRDLARGIYPPLLADQGLRAALEAQARKSVVPVELVPDGVARYPQEVEAAVYFSVLEALQNVAKYAGASRVEVRLDPSDGQLRFEVTDDGRGFDSTEATFGTGLQGIADRLDAIGGRLEVRSAPGGGTTVTGLIPLRT